MVIGFGSLATIPKLIIVRDILQQVIIFIFIKWRIWVLITLEHTFETIAFLFWLDSVGLFSALPANEEGCQNIIKGYTTYLKAVVKFTNDMKTELKFLFSNDFVLCLYVFVDTLFYSVVTYIFISPDYSQFFKYVRWEIVSKTVKLNRIVPSLQVCP